MTCVCSIKMMCVSYANLPNSFSGLKKVYKDED